MNKVYSRINWEDEPSINTPISESNLNKMDYALNEVDTRVARLGGYEEEVATNAAEAIAAAAEAVSSATEAAASAAQADADLAQIFNTGTKIGNTANLNDNVTAGKYYAEHNQTITNAPISGGFAVLVYYLWANTRLVQVVLGIDGSINVRAKYGNNSDNWTGWWKSGETKALVGLKEIATATNFNTITGIGEYWFSPEVASASTNKPFVVGGRMTVEYSVGISNPQFIRQVAYQFGGSDYYARTTSDSGANWTHWFRSSMIDTGA